MKYTVEQIEEALLHLPEDDWQHLIHHHFQGLEPSAQEVLDLILETDSEDVDDFVYIVDYVSMRIV